jgi:hypothetical protein
MNVQGTKISQLPAGDSSASGGSLAVFVDAADSTTKKISFDDLAQSLGQSVSPFSEIVSSSVVSTVPVNVDLTVSDENAIYKYFVTIIEDGSSFFVEEGFLSLNAGDTLITPVTGSSSGSIILTLNIVRPSSTVVRFETTGAAHGSATYKVTLAKIVTNP